MRHCSFARTQARFLAASHEPNIGALMGRIGCWGPSYYNYSKEPPNSIGSYSAPTFTYQTLLFCRAPINPILGSMTRNLQKRGFSRSRYITPKPANPETLPLAWLRQLATSGRIVVKRLHLRSLATWGPHLEGPV